MNIPQDLFYHHYPQDLIKRKFSEDEWVTIYSTELKIINEKEVATDEKNEIESYLCYWAYIITSDERQRVLDTFEEDISNSNRSALYGDNSFKSYVKDGYEPLITEFSFDDINPRKTQIRIHEDLIHMFRLYEDRINDTDVTYSIIENGKLKSVIKVTQNKVRIQHKYLTSFLAAKKMDLVFYIKSELNYKVYSDNKIDFDFEYTGHSGITYYPDDYTALNFSTAITGDQFQSWLEGKMIIPHKQFGEFSSAFDYEYAEFVIGYDDDSCSNILAKPNDFDKSYNKVFFYKAVLEKYRSNTNIHIAENSISCSYPSFCLKCDNGGEEYIWSYLKDLCSLTYEEQKHWSTYCFIPDSKEPSKYWSDTQSNWNVLPTLPDFRFQHIYKDVNFAWLQKFGWLLFKTFETTAQRNVLSRCFMLGEDSDSMFRLLCQTLSLVLNEAINVEELNKLEFNCRKDAKSVSKFGFFLESKGYKRTPIVNFMFKLQKIRSEYTDAHMNSSKPSIELIEAFEFFGLSLDKNNFKEASKQIFRKANEALEELLIKIPEL